MNATLRPVYLAATGLVVMPFLLHAIGLTLTSATDVVIYAMAALGLNLLVGYTGLTSFGHGAWFGLGAYAAALAQKYWFAGSFVLPLAFALAFLILLSFVVGFLVLRRRGVYFSLLTLAFTAMAYAIAFRWSSFTGGESGLGGVERGTLGPIELDHPIVYLATVSVIALAVLYFMQRLTRSPFGTVLVAIRENEQRATFQGYNTTRYKQLAFVISATVTGLAGALFVFHHRFASADPVSVAFSGELLAIVVIGGMRSFLGPVLGAVFYIIFREFLSIWTADWLLYFGLLFVGFIVFSPDGLIGIGARVRKLFRPPHDHAAAMAARKTYADLPLPAFLKPQHRAHDCVLRVQQIAKSFGGIQAVADASLTLEAGHIHALIGPNGAGKTTAFNLISGMFTPNRGSIMLDGARIDGLKAYAICQKGLARSFQITNLFSGSSVYENLRLSVQAKHPGHFNVWRDAADDAAVRAETRELVRFLGLEGIEEAEAGSLSYGGQRLLDLGIALGSKPTVLLLDEPLAGLAAAERERISGLTKTIAADIPVLIVEHDIDRVFSFAHRVTVMNQGKVLMSGSAEQARTDPAVEQVYTGTGIPPVEGRRENARAAQALLLDFAAVDAYYGQSHILNQTSLQVHKGEIVALLGRNGAGKSTLLKTLIGLVPPAAGNIKFDGRGIAGLSAPDITRLGIGYVPQGRGLFSGMTVAENLQLGRLTRQSGEGAHWDLERIFELFPQIRSRLNSPADYLSGGEQQMVAVARALSGNIRLLLLDEPFEGLAPTVVQGLFRVFDRLRETISIVIVEHNLDLVLALADRVYVLERGSVIHDGPAAPLSENLALRKEVLWL